METVIQEKKAAMPTTTGHLSWSGIQAYRLCPRRYFFHYVAQVPDEAKSAALVFGGAIHRTIEAVHEARLAGKPLPSDRILQAIYAAAWDEGTKDGPPIAFAAGEDKQALGELAGRMLTAYLAHVAGEKGEVVGIEHEATFSIPGGAPPLKARLDLLEFSDGNLVVTDFKTSRSRWGEAKIAEGLPQLVLYAHAVAPLARALDAAHIVTRFVVITKAKSPIVQVVEPRPGGGDASRLRELAGETWGAIKKEAWLRREGWQCKQCPFRARCLGRA